MQQVIECQVVLVDILANGLDKQRRVAADSFQAAVPKEGNLSRL